MPGDFHFLAVQHVAQKIGRILNDPTVNIIGFIARTRNKVGRADPVKQRGDLLLAQTIVEWHIGYAGYSCPHQGDWRGRARGVKQTHKLTVGCGKMQGRSFGCAE